MANVINLYHNADFLSYTTGKLIDHAHLTLVAVFESNDLDDVYRMSQNFLGNWTQSAPDSTIIHKHFARSTSVGDVMQVINGSNIEWYVVAPCGFDKIN